jgi:hypothetical protein
LEILDAKSVGRSTLNSIRQDLAVERLSSSWIYLFSILGVLTATVLAIIISCAIYARHITTLKTRIVNILLRTLPEPIVNMIRQPRVAAAALVPPPQQQPLLEADP